MDFLELCKKEIADAATTSWSGDLGGQEVTLYAKPLTPADNEIVLQKYPSFNTRFDMGGMCLYIARKAEDSEGNRVFDPVAKSLPLLKRMGQDKIGEIFEGLFKDQLDESDETVEDVVKN